MLTPVLYNPQSSANKKPILPLSLLALGARLEGHTDYRIVDGNLATDPVEALDAAIDDLGADVLGVTVMPGPQLADALRVCRQLRSRRPHLKILWGGYFPSQHPNVCLDDPCVDFVLRGHAEEGFLQLLQNNADPLRLPTVPGLAYGRGQERRDNGMSKVPSPESLPPYPYTRLPMRRYLRRTFLGERTVGHHSSYGCPFTCNFCAVVNLVEGRWLAEGAERVAQTFTHLRDTYGVDAIELYDNNFFVSEQRCREVAERIRPLGMRYWGEGRVDTMLRFSDATWKAMADSGLAMVFLGAESGSDETLAKMNKGGTQSAAMTLELCARMRSFGVIPELSFVVGSPPEPEADIDRTLGFIRRVKRVHPEAEIIVYLYTPVPLAGSLYESAEKLGFAFPKTLEEFASDRWQNLALRRSVDLPWLAARSVQRIRDFLTVLNAYHPTRTDPHLRRPHRAILRSAAALRYRFGFYDRPVELRLLGKVVSYQRPETAGF